MSNANDFRSYNVIYIVYDCKNENHWSLFIARNTNISHIFVETSGLRVT